MRHPDLLTALEVAAILDQSKATVKRLAKSGALKAVLIGDGKGVYVFERTDVDTYVAARRAEHVEAIAKLDAAS